MDNAKKLNGTQKELIDEQRGDRAECRSVSSPDSAHSRQCFFHSSEQEIEQSDPSPQEPMALDRDSAILLLLSAVLQELKRHNDLELYKLKIEEQKKQAEMECAEQERIEDEKHFNSIRNSMYS